MKITILILFLSFTLFSQNSNPENGVCACRDYIEMSKKAKKLTNKKIKTICEKGNNETLVFDWDKNQKWKIDYCSESEFMISLSYTPFNESIKKWTQRGSMTLMFDMDIKLEKYMNGIYEYYAKENCKKNNDC